MTQEYDIERELFNFYSLIDNHEPSMIHKNYILEKLNLLISEIPLNLHPNLKAWVNLNTNGKL